MQKIQNLLQRRKYSATNKKLKVILKGVELKWNLPSSMAENAYHFFNAYKDIEEQLLAENPIRSNLQQVIALDDFIRSLLPLQTFATSDN